jgi:hypothetical protein
LAALVELVVALSYMESQFNIATPFVGAFIDSDFLFALASLVAKINKRVGRASEKACTIGTLVND